MADEYTGFSMADAVGVLVRRRAVVLGIVVLSLVAAAATSLLSTPRYTSTATVYPLGQSTLQLEWLSSRTVAGVVLDEHEDALLPLLFPTEWDAASGAWKDEAPTRAEAEAELADHVLVQVGPGGTKGPSRSVLVVMATLPDPDMARVVADAYLDTLPLLRPSLENVTRLDAFRGLYNERYNESNVESAQDRADLTVATTMYWIVLDHAGPAELVWPNHVANIVVSAVGGLVIGVAGAGTLEWVARNRVRWA